jgi:hypothetical protein
MILPIPGARDNSRPTDPKTIATAAAFAGPHALNGAGLPGNEHLRQRDFGVGRGLAGERANLALFTNFVAHVNGKAKGGGPPAAHARRTAADLLGEPARPARAGRRRPRRRGVGRHHRGAARRQGPPQGAPAGGRQAEDGPMNERNP